jgi:hypothetical protein
VFARVRSLGPQTPHFGEIEHLGDHLQATIGIVGDVTKIVMEFSYIGPGHLSDAVVAKRWKDKALQHALVAFGGARLEPDIDVLLLEALG